MKKTGLENIKPEELEEIQAHLKRGDFLLMSNPSFSYLMRMDEFYCSEDQWKTHFHQYTMNMSEPLRYDMEDFHYWVYGEPPSQEGGSWVKKKDLWKYLL